MPTHRAELALIERELANRRRAVVTANRLDQLEEQINPATRETQTGADHPLTPFEERWTLDQQLTSRNDHGIEIEI